ncbi:MAG TPA: cation:proton antiporter [Haloplasmataceae bacterium]
MNIILKISIVLAAGLLGGKLANRLKLPNVTGYIIAGLFLGSSFFKLLSEQELAQLDIVSEMALAFIAFSIGSELVYSELRKVGKKIMIITIFEALGAVLLVFVAMFFLFGQPLSFSLVLASMSAATAPAATLLVMRQYRAYGPLTKTIIPVVALDDVVGIVAFGIAIPIARLTMNDAALSVGQSILHILWEIFGSLLIGGILGLGLTLIGTKLKARDDFQVTALVAIGLGMGCAKVMGLSPLLVNMMVGLMLVNLSPQHEKAFNAINDFVPPFYVLFFALAGAGLDLSVLKVVGMIGMAYVFARGIGKALGAFVGAVSTKAEKVVSRYLGLALLPQGGVSIGLSILVRQQLPEFAKEITTIIMFSVLIYEITGPIFAKIAIQKAGEINGMDRVELASMKERAESMPKSQPLTTES